VEALRTGGSGKGVERVHHETGSTDWGRGEHSHCSVSQHWHLVTASPPRRPAACRLWWAFSKSLHAVCAPGPQAAEPEAGPGRAISGQGERQRGLASVPLPGGRGSVASALPRSGPPLGR